MGLFVSPFAINKALNLHERECAYYKYVMMNDFTYMTFAMHIEEAEPLSIR